MGAKMWQSGSNLKTELVHEEGIVHSIWSIRKVLSCKKHMGMGGTLWASVTEDQCGLRWLFTIKVGWTLHLPMLQRALFYIIGLYISWRRTMKLPHIFLNHLRPCSMWIFVVVVPSPKETSSWLVTVFMLGLSLGQRFFQVWPTCDRGIFGLGGVALVV